AAAQLGAPRRPGRDQPPRPAAGVVHHAGESEPGDPRSRESGLLRRDRRRRHGDAGGRSGPAAAQRVRAGDRVPSAAQHRDTPQRVRGAARALRRRDHREPVAHAALRRALHRHRYRARAGDRIREGFRDREAGARERTRRVRAGAGAETLVAGRARQAAQSGFDDRAMSPRRRKRLDPAVFQLPADRIKAGEFSDRGAGLAAAALKAAKKTPRVLLQVTVKQGGHLSGIDEAIAILKCGVEDWNALAVNALYEGDLVQAWDTVMT